MVWAQPCQPPTRMGPKRSCIWAATLRSAYTATMGNSATSAMQQRHASSIGRKYCSGDRKTSVASDIVSQEFQQCFHIELAIADFRLSI